jgi:hypothetical protein
VVVNIDKLVSRSPVSTGLVTKEIQSTWVVVSDVFDVKNREETSLVFNLHEENEWCYMVLRIESEVGE